MYQRVGHSSCIRCDFTTTDEMSFDEQDAALMAHLTEKHPDWMTDGVVGNWLKNIAVPAEPQDAITKDDDLIIDHQCGHSNGCGYCAVLLSGMVTDKAAYRQLVNFFRAKNRAISRLEATVARLGAYREWLRDAFRDIAKGKCSEEAKADLYRQYARDCLSGPTEETLNALIRARTEGAKHE